jgi:hypothetical protein
MTLKTLFHCTAAALVAAGCATEPAPRVELHFGTAVNAAKAQQTLNPDASRNTDPVAGIDGAAANHAINEYYKSFQAPPPTFPVINIGAGATGQ